MRKRGAERRGPPCASRAGTQTPDLPGAHGRIRLLAHARTFAQSFAQSTSYLGGVGDAGVAEVVGARCGLVCALGRAVAADGARLQHRGGVTLGMVVWRGVWRGVGGIGSADSGSSRFAAADLQAESLAQEGDNQCLQPAHNAAVDACDAAHIDERENKEEQLGEAVPEQLARQKLVPVGLEEGMGVGRRK